MGLVGSKLRMAAIRDITKRKQTEEALKDREIQMRSITDSAYDAIIMLDTLGKITYWNLPQSEFGYTKEEALGKDPKDLSCALHTPCESPLDEFFETSLK